MPRAGGLPHERRLRLDGTDRRTRLGRDPNWGCDGRDLGSWPYVMVAGIRTADRIGNLTGVATYCEGDVKTTYYRTSGRSGK
ncbi:MAG: hypothetical protein JWO49_2677 [Arthrobacter sp.]|nr:hypothetical protein [Arthrobacter sp.]